MFKCFTRWGQLSGDGTLLCWSGALCVAKHWSSLREVIAGNGAGQELGSMSKQRVWKPRFGLWASVLDHKRPFWSWFYFKPSWESIFYMGASHAMVCKPARNHCKKNSPANLIKSTLSSSLRLLILPCIHTRKQTNWRNNKNNEHSELRLAFTWLSMKAIKAARTRRVLNFLSQ